MKQDLTEIGVVIDRSGSMESVASDAIGGFNSFLLSQQEQPGQADMTVVLFNDQVSTYAKSKPIKEVSPLTRGTYNPQGMTSLYDAVGYTIKTIGDKLSILKEENRPSKVIIAILTDGAENSSSTYSRNQVLEMIKLQRDTYNWEFIFLAAGEAAFKEGQNLGMATEKMALFNNDTKGNGAAFEMLCSYSSNLRSASENDYQDLRRSVNIQSIVDSNLSKESN